MNRILVTGGSGFAGINIAEFLLARAAHVILFDKNDMPELALEELRRLPGRLDIVKGDIRDADAVRDAARGSDAIIHGAAITPGSTEESALARLAVDVNVSGTINVMHAARHTRMRRVVFLGSASVYGAHAWSCAELDETLVAPVPESLYAITKLAAEKLAQRLAKSDGIDLRCVRIGSVFGPWEYASGVRDTLSAILQVTRAVYLDPAAEAVLPRPGRRDWIYSRDMANAILHVLDCDAAPEDPVNIGLGTEWSVSDWCERLSQRFPGFRYRLADAGEDATIDYHGNSDRPPLATLRLTRAIGFEPQYDLARSFVDYMDWIGRHREFFERSIGG